MSVWVVRQCELRGLRVTCLGNYVSSLTGVGDVDWVLAWCG